jgi:HPt (histidine-containing phosphotransfer) domain-containing protein
MSAHANKKERRKCRAAGMNDYIHKPFKPERLQQKIYELTAYKDKLPKREKSTSTQGQEAQTKKQESTREARTNDGSNSSNLVDLTELKEMAGDNEDFVVRMIDKFIEQTRPELEKMKHFLQEADYASFKDTAHKMKSAVPFIGNQKLERLVNEMDEEAASEPNPDKLEQLLHETQQLCEQVIDKLEEEKKELNV